MNKKNSFSLVLFSLALVLIAGFGQHSILRAVGNFLVVKDELKMADVIVVLGGDDKERVAQAVALYKEGWAPCIIVSGSTSDASGTMARGMEKLAEKYGVPKERILLEPKAMHTYQHPVFVKPIMIAHGFKSAIVVSSPYHMRRSSMLFEHTFWLSGIKLYFYPALGSWFKSDHWWLSLEGRRVVFSEYAKLIVNFWGTGFNDFVYVKFKK